MSDGVDMSEEQQSLIGSLECPLRWLGACPEHEVRLWFHFAWYAVARRNQIDNEVSFLISCDDFCPDIDNVLDLDDEEVSVYLERVRTWYPNAAREYLGRYARLFSMRAANKKIYGKHYTKKKVSLAALRRESRRSPGSLMRSSMSVELQGRLFWGALNELLDSQLRGVSTLEAHEHPATAEKVMMGVFGGAKLLFAVDFGREVGASEGDAEEYGQFDVDFSTGQFHFYPVDKEQFNKADLKCRVQGWNYGLD